MQTLSWLLETPRIQIYQRDYIDPLSVLILPLSSIRCVTAAHAHDSIWRSTGIKSLGRVSIHVHTDTDMFCQRMFKQNISVHTTAKFSNKFAQTSRWRSRVHQIPQKKTLSMWSEFVFFARWCLNIKNRKWCSCVDRKIRNDWPKWTKCQNK